MELCTVQIVAFLVQSISPLMSVSQQVRMEVQVMNTEMLHTLNKLALFILCIGFLDYGVVNTILVFAACEMRSCVDVFITDDIILEKDESFGITLRRTRDLDSRIILDPVNGVIEVADNDGT